MPINISRRVKKVSSTYFATQKEFGEALGVKGDTFLGYFKKGREDNLLPLLPRILEKYPSISKYWLYFGEGDMFTHDDYTAAKTINAQGLLIGDLLRVALDFMQLAPEEAAMRSGIAIETLQVILENRLVPSFAHLEALYLKLGIAPSYFFDGNEKQMCRPKDPLLQVFYALGKQGVQPSYLEVASIFDIPFDEAKAFMEEWKTFKAKGRERVLPSSWHIKLRERSELCTAFLHTGNPPIIRLVERQQNNAAVHALQKELEEMREKCALQQKLIAMYEEREMGEAAQRQAV